ncbi:FkbM family methyltransferase [Erythrobacter sp. MTPC3]
MLADISTKYLRAYYNEGFYEFAENGESFALRTFAEWAGNNVGVIWDVGANDGGWATEAVGFFPEAKIHSFEIVPTIADTFEKQFSSNPNVALHRFGLSDHECTVDVSYNVKYHSTSSINYRATDEFGTDIKTVECSVKTIDAVIARGLAPPVLLKIDTEGHDLSVLRGGKQLLTSGNAPAMIQFEYGETWLPANETLENCSRLLTEAGYRLGRLYPTHVEFKDYGYEDDHYRMGNMIAVRDDRLLNMFAPR